MSRNEDRLGQPKVPVADPPQTLQPTQETATLSFPSQTEFVEIPSEGKYYPSDHPLHNKKEVELKYLTAKEEDILTNMAYLKKGVAVTKMLQSILVDKTIDLDTLLVGDKNALIVAARANGYGTDYSGKVVCSFCGDGFSHDFDLSEASPTQGELELSGGEKTENNTLLFTLPKTGLKVELKLLTGVDEKKLSMMKESKKKHNLPETNLTDQLKLTIVSVNGVTDQGQISKCIDSLPAIDTRWVRAAYKRAVPDVDLVFSVECPRCESKQEVQMPFGAEFFWPKQ